VSETWLRVIAAVLIAFIAWRLAILARVQLDRLSVRAGADPNAQLLAGRLTYGLILVLGLIWILGLIGVESASVLTTFGVFGLALSLAAQDILKSFFAGLYLLFERPFLIGDEVQVKEHIGRVESVGFRATAIRTDENVLVVVPNAIVFAEVISNRSRRGGTAS